jgi:hypothetical protein
MRAFLGLTRRCVAPRDQTTSFRLLRLAAAFQAPQSKATHASHHNTRAMSAEATNSSATEEISFL